MRVPCSMSPHVNEWVNAWMSECQSAQVPVCVREQASERTQKCMSLTALQAQV